MRVRLPTGCEGEQTMGFFETELEHQILYRRGGGFPKSGQVTEVYDLRVLPKAYWEENLHPLIRGETVTYFQTPSRDCSGRITWHKMRGHLLSSQVACVNFLMPFATRPRDLEALLQRVFPGEKLRVQPISHEGVEGEDRYVAFEWVGRGNHLSEAADGSKLTRGANCTSTDAMVLVEVSGRLEMLLIEWKYTEKYGSPVPNPARKRADGTIETANDERRRRYADKLFAPAGPLKRDPELSFDDFLWEPLYQLARQQMLAFQLEKAKEEGVDVVRVLHIGPAANTALNRITSPKLRDRYPDQGVFEMWPALLVHPDRFIKRSIGDLFSSSPASPDLKAWHREMTVRYSGAIAQARS